MKMKGGRKLIMIVVGILVLFSGMTVGGGLYLLDYALCPEMVSPDVAKRNIRDAYVQVNPWLDSLERHHALQDTFIVAPDGTKLHAIYAGARKPTDRTAVIVHGYTDQANEMLHIGYLYHQDLNCNILLLDLRYAGLTEGKAIQMGWKDRRDVQQWIAFAPHLFGDSVAIVVHGISMGAATTMMTSGEELPASVRCFVEDCGYTSVWDQFSKELKEQFGLPNFPLLHVASQLCDWKYGWNFTEASAVEQIKKCHRPMLFIHGDSDDYVPTWMVHELYQAKPEPKELWVTKGVDHAHSYLKYPKEYTQHVKTFIEKYLDR